MQMLNFACTETTLFIYDMYHMQMMWLSLLHVCCCFLLSPTAVGELHSFPHVPMMCVVFGLLMMFSFIFTTGNVYTMTGSE